MAAEFKELVFDNKIAETAHAELAGHVLQVLARVEAAELLDVDTVAWVQLPDQVLRTSGFHTGDLEQI